MAFPVVETTATSGGTSPTLPSGINVGDLLVLFVAAWRFSGAPVLSGFSGYTQLFSVSSGSRLRFVGYYRIATGSDGTSYSSDIGGDSLNHFYRISGHNSEIEATATTGTGSSTPNPPSETASWGARENLWLSACGMAIAGNPTVTATPTNYTDLLATEAETGSVDGCLGSARRNLSSDTDDPGTFTCDVSGNWGAGTVVISGPPIIDGVVSAGGSSAVSLVGNSLFSASYSIAGVAVPTFVGQAAGASLGDFTIPGVATVNFAGFSFAEGALSAAGVATANFGVIREGALSAAGIAAVTFSPNATIESPFSSQGAAEVAFVSGFEDIWVEDEPLTGSWTEEARLT